MIVTLDFETYYDHVYSLKKLTTEEYIRDSRFEAIGVSIKYGKQPAEFFSGHAIKGALESIDWENNYLLAHNCRFDASILHWKYGHTPRGYLDTLSMARALHGVNVGGSLAFLAEYYGIGKKGDEVINAMGQHLADFTKQELADYGSYCINDTNLCYGLFDRMRGKFPQSELLVINMFLRMFVEPVLEVDTGKLYEYIEELKSERERILSESGADIKQLRSDAKYAALLQDAGIDPPKKVSPTTGKEVWAFAKTDAAHMELLEYPDIRVQTLVSARLGTKSSIEETRAQRILDIGLRGRLPIPLKYNAAHTGRAGGDDKINMQNLPTRGARTAIKDCMMAPEGYSILDPDSAQIEARVLAYIAGQDDLVKDFSEGKDVYRGMAEIIYKKPATSFAKDSRERQVGKKVILGSGYGMWAHKFRAQLRSDTGIELDIKECEKIILAYRKRYKKIPELWKNFERCLDALIDEFDCPFGVGGIITLDHKEMGFRLPNGLHIRYPGLKRLVKDDRISYTYLGRGKKETNVYGGMGVENLIQGLAFVIMKEQMVSIAKHYRVILNVHDSMPCIVKDDQLDEAKGIISQIMRVPPSWGAGIPLDCDIKIGKYYGGCV